MRTALVLSSLLVFHGFHQGVPKLAQACGPTPDLVEGLLPESGAKNVPLNAALIAASNFDQLELQLFLLSESGEQGSDAGLVAPGDAGTLALGDAAASTVEVELEKECYAGLGGELCVGKPIAQLKPRSAYRWVATARRSSAPDLLPTELAGTFRTGTTLHSASLSASDISVKITEHKEFDEPNTCGTKISTTFALSSSTIEAPAVVNFAGLTPNGVFMPVLLGDGARVEVGMTDAPRCVTPEVFDLTGARTTLPELCRTEGNPPDGPGKNDPGKSGDKDEPAAEPRLNATSDSSQSGCQLSATASPSGVSLLAIAFAACAALRRRRRLS